MTPIGPTIITYSQQHYTCIILHWSASFDHMSISHSEYCNILSLTINKMMPQVSSRWLLIRQHGTSEQCPKDLSEGSWAAMLNYKLGIIDICGALQTPLCSDKVAIQTIVCSGGLIACGNVQHLGVVTALQHHLSDNVAPPQACKLQLPQNHWWTIWQFRY